LFCGFAQDTVDPKIAEQIRAFTMKYEEALNEHDAATTVAFFAEDAVWRTPQGTFYGRRAIEKRLESYHFHRWHIKNEVINVDRVTADGDEIRAVDLVAAVTQISCANLSFYTRPGSPSKITKKSPSIATLACSILLTFTSCPFSRAIRLDLTPLTLNATANS
jgi:uncharacterized protein (TIGR02246 family)